MPKGIPRREAPRCAGSGKILADFKLRHYPIDSLASIRAAFSGERSPLTCRFCYLPNSSSSSTSRPPGHSGLDVPTAILLRADEVIE